MQWRPPTKYICHKQPQKWEGSVDFFSCLHIFVGFNIPYMPNFGISAGSEHPPPPPPPLWWHVCHINTPTKLSGKVGLWSECEWCFAVWWFGVLMQIVVLLGNRSPHGMYRLCVHFVKWVRIYKNSTPCCKFHLHTSPLVPSQYNDAVSPVQGFPSYI